MSNIARKNRLAQNLEKMRREFPREYSFYPRTWVLPLELADFRAQFDSSGHSSRFYIIKPDSGCQGRGIFLTQKFDNISPLEQVVAQHYIRKPFLIDGYKFDLRLYVLVTSCKPLRIHLSHDGLVRFCTQEYLKPNADNVAVRCMHLTNYAINKHSENFQGNKNLDASDVGSKRSLQWFMQYIATEQGQSKADALWRRMGSMVVKVMISILPTLVREYESTFFKGTGSQIKDITKGETPMQCFDESNEKHPTIVQGSRCFEVLGVDVIIDHALKPWLVEVNHLPSFATESPLDLDIKSRVIEQTISTIRVKSGDRFNYEQSERCKAEARLYSQLGTKTGSIETKTPCFRSQVEAILQKFAPEKLEKVDALLNKYAGREAKLVQLVEQKYLEPEYLPRKTGREVIADAEDADPEISVSTDCSETDNDTYLEDQLLVNFDRLYPVPSVARAANYYIPDYKALKKYVFAQDKKRLKRMSCPLRQNRGSALYFAKGLPPLVDGTRNSRDGRIPWGNPFRNSGEAARERKVLPMPGQRQLAAADRLARGFSSRQHSSAPSSLGINGSDGLCSNGRYAQKVASTVAHAKEWRRRMDDGRNHRNHTQVALQPKTFLFTQTAETPRD